MIVTLSSKGQVVLPAPVRRQLGLKPRTRLRLTMGDGWIELSPLRRGKEPVPHLPVGSIRYDERDYALDRLAGPDVAPDFK
jgi:AbrB family looped-hinge helix DNA binding protein